MTEQQENYQKRLADELQKIIDATGCFTFSTAYTVLLLLMFWGSARVLLRWPLEYCIQVMLVLIMIVGGLLLLRNRLVNRYRWQTAKQLESRDLITRLALGTDWLEEIYRFTPIPFSWLHLGVRPVKLPNWIRLLANNLDWYLGRPRTLLRPEWIAMDLGFAVLILLVLNFLEVQQINNPNSLVGGQMSGQMISRFQDATLNQWVLLGVLQVLGLIHDYLRMKQRVSAELLLKSMRERFDA